MPDPPPDRRPLRGTALKRFHREVRRLDAPRRQVCFVLEHVNYPVNVGSLFRIADACGAEVVLAGTTPDPVGPKIAKVARGRQTTVAWRRFADGPAAIEALRAEGFWVAAVELTADALPYHEAPFPDRVALVLGNEDHGVTRPSLAATDAAVYVPMFGRGASLNVHVAAAVVAYRARLGASRGDPSSPST